MASPLLATKLSVPRRRPGLMPRPRLSERLTRGTQAALTLVSAPAGFGKTTLLTEWLATSDDRSVAWLSLDPSDNDATTFWSYLIAALQTVAPEIGASALSLLQASQPPATQAVLATLLNELGTRPTELVLVLDDYHVIDARAIHDGLAFLLDHLPPHVHLLIASRADPALPLARLRVRGELVEVRTADLRFTPAEVAVYLTEVMGLALTAEEVAALEGRTEGWIAALQLAALSLRGRDDVTGFIASFAGDDRYIVDYLVEEVLQRQTDRVRSFLLQTAILDRLSGPLCDAVTAQEGGQVMLAALERGNLFVTPLDERRRWYRYHLLFADVLRAHLLDEQPDTVQDLHRRASAWYEQHGEPAAAIQHALAAGDVGRAAALIELALPAMRQRRQEATILDWLRTLPDDVICVRPVLSAAYGGALLASGECEGVEARLRDAERWLGASADSGVWPDATSAMVVVDDEAFRRLPGAIAVWRAGLALVQGDVAGTVTYARRAHDLVPDDDVIWRGAAVALLGLAAWASGDLQTAQRLYAEGMARVQQAGYLSDVMSSAIALADIQVTQGRLHEAMRTYENTLQLGVAEAVPSLRGTADIYVGMSGLACERNELATATQHLLRSQELGERTGLPYNRSRWCVAMARVLEIRGDFDGALDLLQEAERLHVGGFFPNVRPIAALTARVWVAQGRLADALGWVRERGLSADGDLSYLREFGYLTLARVLIDRYRTEGDDRFLQDAGGLLKRLLHAAEAGGRMGSAIAILVLEALAQSARGDLAAALVPLERALTLAEPEGYVRVFIDEGPPLTTLLKAARKRGVASSYVSRLLVAFGEPADSTPAIQGMIEPLSARERDVLRLLGTDLSGPDIARELSVSLNTMRTHTKSIFTKLGVGTRQAAVRRAEDLGLLAPTRTHQHRSGADLGA